MANDNMIPHDVPELKEVLLRFLDSALVCYPLANAVLAI